MKQLLSITGIALVCAVASTIPASAHTRCDGDLQNIHGNWIATPYCERRAAEHAANSERPHATWRAAGESNMTPDEFCRWHVGEIETETYCSSYND